jgi:hypothetical protein
VERVVTRADGERETGTAAGTGFPSGQSCNRSECECHSDRHPQEWAADGVGRHNETRLDEIIHSLGGGGEAADARARAMRALPPKERVRFLRGCVGMLREFLVEAEWRQDAVQDLCGDLQAATGGNADDLCCAVESIYQVMWTFADYALLGGGQAQTYYVPDEAFLRLDDAAFAEIERRLAKTAAGQ